MYQNVLLGLGRTIRHLEILHAILYIAFGVCLIFLIASKIIATLLYLYICGEYQV